MVKDGKNFENTMSRNHAYIYIHISRYIHTNWYTDVHLNSKPDDLDSETVTWQFSKQNFEL